VQGLNNYRFNGKELQLDLGIAWNHQDWRFFDPQLFRWHAVDPEIEDGQESWSPYSFGFNNNMRYADADGRAPGDYYSKDGEYLGTDGKTDKAVYSSTGVVKNENGLVVSSEDTERLSVSSHEFTQIAAFAFNETFTNSDIDKFRIASAIVAQNATQGGTMQHTIDGLRYNGDTHKARLENYSKLPATGTKEYSKFFKTAPEARNNNPAMKMATAAAVNATSKDGKKYSLSKDGKTKAIYWRGAKGNSRNNRYFTGYPPSSKNQVKEFQENETPR
jgi:RHS repeat-associated protein